ncbi:EMIL1-like protein [Mya arenaria]|uniref:EMIL1-like protein n=1 Tax=Mya arenaria TaxID=6604 RepID=A0ABY7EUI7_MYAAR|nr:EMILIN-1-like [Mya arenaria]WAR13593.1 EMIL1-like protein [Mya arenaria]
MKQNVIFFVLFASFILICGINTRHEREINDRNAPERPIINSEQKVVQEHSSTVETITKTAFRKRFRRRPPAIAFQAVLKKKSLVLQTNEPITFDRVFTNEGEGYDEKTGIFTAPVGGLYVFSATILAGNGYYTEGSIVVKDNTIVTAVSDRRTLKETQIDIADQSTVTCNLKTQKGDTVKFMIKWPMGQHEIIGHGKTSFGGYLFRAYP